MRLNTARLSRDSKARRDKAAPGSAPGAEGAHGGAVGAALLADLTIAALKFSAAHMSGSAAMFAEGMHSLVDASTEIVLLYGFLAAARPATASYQVGFGRESFFWSFIAAMLILAAGAGVTMIDGARQVLAPKPQGGVLLNYGVLALSAAIELAASAYVLRGMSGLGRKGGLRRFVRTTRDTVALTVVFSSVAGLLGLALAAAGIFLSDALDRPALDGIASVGISLILALTALIIAAKCRSLLIGVAAPPATLERIATVAADHPGVLAINGSITVYLGPRQLLVALSVTFCEHLTAPAIERAVAQIDANLKTALPDVVTVFVKPQSREDFMRLKLARGW